MYEIFYNSTYGREVIDTAETVDEAEYLVHEYKAAFKSDNITFA